MVNYSEAEAGQGGIYSAQNKVLDAGGMGGAPSIESGNTEVTMNVSVTYEIR